MATIGDLAASLGLPVFPCEAHKRPIVAKWPEVATADPAEVRRMFAADAATMIGLPTGRASGLVVIDVDVKNGAQGDAWLQENTEALPETRTHRTQSGGLHLVFRLPEGVEIRNSASRVAPGVDVRGEGGYVIWPGSPGYTVADATEPAEMPRWLIRACLSPETPRTATDRPEARHERYTQAAIDGEIAQVIRAGEGTRNNTLHTAAIKLGTLVGAGQMTRADAEAELMRAAGMVGLPAREALATIKSGLDFGQANPRKMPERREALHHDEPPPDMPDDPGWWQSLEKSMASEPAEDDGSPAEVADIEPPQIENGGIIDPRTWTAPAPLRQWLIQDWIPIGYATGIYGDGGLGKSLLCQQLLTSVATGLPWLDMPTRAGPAFGFMCEDDPAELHRRQEAINRQLGLEPSHLELLRYTSRLGLDNILMTFDERNRPELTALFKDIVTFLATFRPRLVVLDTLADIFGGEEVKRAHARQFVQGVAGNIARAFDCAVVVAAHPSASGLSSGSGTSGNTAWSNTFRSRLYLTGPKDDDADPDTRQLERKKANYSKRGEGLTIKWEDGAFVTLEATQAQTGMDWPAIHATFAEIDAAWKRGDPWSNAPQTRKDGRYLPTWMAMTHGISNREAASLVERWTAGGYLKSEIYDNRTKARGLRVLKVIQP